MRHLEACPTLLPPPPRAEAMRRPPSTAAISQNPRCKWGFWTAGATAPSVSGRCLFERGNVLSYAGDALKTKRKGRIGLLPLSDVSKHLAVHVSKASQGDNAGFFVFIFENSLGQLLSARAWHADKARLWTEKALFLGHSMNRRPVLEPDPSRTWLPLSPVRSKPCVFSRWWCGASPPTGILCGP